MESMSITSSAPAAKPSIARRSRAPGLPRLPVLGRVCSGARAGEQGL
jgi:hypothetical protein